MVLMCQQYVAQATFASLELNYYMYTNTSYTSSCIVQ